MKFKNKVAIIIKFGYKQKDKIEINTNTAEIKWDKNSFIIRGLFKEDVIKVGENEKYIK